MTQRLYLHVGAPKSGTTYLQHVLEANRERLAQDGVLVVGRHLDRVHAAMVVREDPRLEDLGPKAHDSWQRLVREVREWKGATAVLSYELFAGASREQVARALAALDGVEVHVVITARDLGKAVPSAWQERLKFALTKPLEKWRIKPESAGPRSEWGWRTMDPAGVAARWGAGLPAAQVHVVTVPRSATDPDELWRRFAEACSITTSGLDLSAERANESLGLPAAELLRRVNERMRPPITGSREQSVWIRDLLAHQVLADQSSEPLGLTQRQYADASAQAEQAIGAITAAGYAVHGDLEDLRATRPEARRTTDVGDDELLDLALETIVRLLIEVRERSTVREQAEPEAPGMVGRGKNLLRRATAPYVDRQVDQLRARVAELEATVRRDRQLQLRVAELQDVVTELLLPAAQANRKVTKKALERYRERAL